MIYLGTQYPPSTTFRYAIEPRVAFSAVPSTLHQNFQIPMASPCSSAVQKGQGILAANSHWPYSHWPLTSKLYEGIAHRCPYACKKHAQHDIRKQATSPLIWQSLAFYRSYRSQMACTQACTYTRCNVPSPDPRRACFPKEKQVPAPVDPAHPPSWH